MVHARTSSPAAAAAPHPPRSPFVTPHHPLFVFGEEEEDGIVPTTPLPSRSIAVPSTAPFAPLRNHNNFDLVRSEREAWLRKRHGVVDSNNRRFPPGNKRHHRNCLDSMMGMSLSSPIEEEEEQQQRPRRLQRLLESDNNNNNNNNNETARDVFSPPTWSRSNSTSPIRNLRRSDAFDLEDEPMMMTMTMTTPSPSRQPPSPPLTPPTPPPFAASDQHHLVLDGDDLQHSDQESLSRRLRRMKRRLFLEQVAAETTTASNDATTTNPFQFPSLSLTPKISNQFAVAAAQPPPSPDAGMEGMEVVLEEIPFVPAPAGSFSSSDHHHHHHHRYHHHRDVDGGESSKIRLVVAGFQQQPFLPIKRLSSDSFATDATAASTAIGDETNDDPHWASLSSIYEDD